MSEFRTFDALVAHAATVRTSFAPDAEVSSFLASSDVIHFAVTDPETNESITTATRWRKALDDRYARNDGDVLCTTVTLHDGETQVVVMAKLFQLTLSDVAKLCTLGNVLVASKMGGKTWDAWSDYLTALQTAVKPAARNGRRKLATVGESY